MITFNNKNILIVGASSGIGAMTARVLSKQGAKVILVARREDKLKEVCESIESNNKSYYIGDASRIDDIEELIKKIVAEQGKLDGLVYAAGMSQGDVPLKLLTYERHISTFMTNYFGFVEFVRQVTKRNRFNSGLRIVAVSSIASIMGDKAHLAYSASKAAIDSAVRCLAKELAEKDICINTVAPSMIRTEMYDNWLKLRQEYDTGDTGILDRQYLGIGETSDVANAIAFLMSDESRFITGIMLPVDGGFSTSC